MQNLVKNRLFLLFLSVFYFLQVPLSAEEQSSQVRSWIQTQGLERAARRYDDIVFTQDQTGFTVNGNGEIYRTTNRGQTWTNIFHEQGVYLRTIDFLDDGKTGFVGALANDKFYKTTDGGTTWTNISDKLPGHQSICGVDHYGSLVFAVGNFRITAAQFYRSVDAGETWELIDLSSQASGLIDVKFLSPKTGFIAGTSKEKGAIILRTENGGSTWFQVYPDRKATTYPTDPADIMWKLHFVNESVAYGSVYSATSDVSKIVKTTDGGRTWQTLIVDQNKNWQLEGIGFIDENSGWTGGYAKGAMMTTDGGKTWTHREDGGNFNRLYFVGSEGYAAGGGVFKLSEPGSTVRVPANLEPEVIPHSALVKKKEVCAILDQDTHVTVRTLDATGHFIDDSGKNNFVLAQKPMTKGPHCFNPQKTYHLADGQYFLEFRTNERIFSKKFQLKNKIYSEVSERLPSGH